MAKYIAIFVLILVVVISVAGFWYWQSNQYSKEILKLEILGPEKLTTGEEVEYILKLKNNGKVRLEDVELSFEYPENVIPETNREQRVVESLEDIYPGEERILTFKGIAFGVEKDVLEAKVLVIYRLKNLKAPYDRETTFLSQISQVPLTFEFDLPLKTEQGVKMDFSLNYFSNINYILENLRVKIIYPNGFTFLNSSPKAIDQTEWDLPNLTQANGGRVQIEGVLEGSEGESKVFKAQLGVVKDDMFILLKEATHSIEIIEPSLFISQLINASQNYAVNPDELLHYEIFFKNIGNSPIQKKFLFVNLESVFFDFDSLKSDQGEVGRGDNSIIWDWKAVQDLRFLDAGQEGKVDFWVRTKSVDSGLQNRKNPVLKTKVTLGGTEKTFEVKMNSALSLEQKVYYSDEVFGNSGPLPPEVGKRTTYTVLWQINNYWNDLQNVKVRTALPQGVSVTGSFFPEDAKFTFDSLSKEVLWNVGEVKAINPSSADALPLTLAFQVALIPDSSQRNTMPQIVSQAEISGQDVFTSDIVEETAQPVDSSLPDDNTVSVEQGIAQ